jgi:hypothetical protein
VKVYIVTYDDYDLEILKVFTTEAAAQTYIWSFNYDYARKCNVIEMELEQ